MKCRRCWPALVFGLAACAQPQQVTGPSGPALLLAVKEAVTKPYAALEANFARLSCRRELRAALIEIRSQCAATALAPWTARLSSVSSAQAAALSPCAADVMNNTIRELDDRLSMKFARELYTRIDHEVIYFVESKPIMDMQREEQVRALLKVPMLSSTRILLITAADKGDAEAERRLEWMLKYLLEQKVPADRIDRPLKYQLRLPGELDPADKNVPPEPDDQARMGWIFRLPC